ncbi:hypothetical protein 035JT004_246 [Bacillus phage 035JT004]|nr:hypothetical protein 035JT004_246 [Bacillus phage 035JT004]
MAKDWVYIGSTPPELTREANEAEIRKYAEKAKQLRKEFDLIKEKMKDSQ